MPPRLLTILALLLLTPVTWAGPAAVAIVDVDELFTNYHVAKTKKGSIESLRERLGDDPRIELIRQLNQEVAKLRARLKDPQLLVSEKEEMFGTYQSKAHELSSLQRDLRQHMQSEQAKLDAELVKLTRSLLASIRAEIAAYAESEGYQVVFEKSGRTSSQVPTLLYSRHAVDITAAVLKRLNRDQPQSHEGPEDEAVSSNSP